MYVKLLSRVGTYLTSDSSLTHLFHCRTSDTHGCTHAFTTRYTTVDAMTEIGTASATGE